jgi:hypothetical protein
MTTTDLDTLLAHANPLPDDAARALGLPDTELLEAIIAQPREPARRAPRVGRRRAGCLGVAIALAGAVAAIAFAGLPGGSGPGEGTPGAPPRAWAAGLVRFAEASPLVLLAVPAWRVDYANESSAAEGEMRFVQDKPIPRRLVITGGRPSPKAVIEHARRQARLNWRAGPLTRWKRERANDAVLHTTAPVLGTAADVYEYRAAGQFGMIRDYHAMTALWKDGARVMEFSWAAPSVGAFKRLLAGLRRVDTDVWLSAMPASVVKRAIAVVP